MTTPIFVSCPMSSIEPVSTLGDFEPLLKAYKVVVYTLPDMSSGTAIKHSINYARVHNWAKDHIDTPYYLQMWTREVYVLVSQDIEPSPFQYKDLTLEVRIVAGKELYKDHIEAVMNLILSDFLLGIGKYVSNEKCFIFAKADRANKGATALSIQLRRQRGAFKDRPKPMMVVIARAAKFQRIEKEAYLQKAVARRIPYLLEFGVSGGAMLRQMKPSELASHKGPIWIQRGNRRYRAKLPFLSLESTEAYRQSRVGIVGEFMDQFLAHLDEKGLKWVHRHANFKKIAAPKHRFQVAMKTAKFQLQDVRVQRSALVDQAFCDHLAAQLGIERLSIAQDAPEVEVPMLLLMDADRAYYKQAGQKGKDPYKTFKRNYRALPSQGVNINPHIFDPTQEPEHYFNYNLNLSKDQMRNLHVSMRQLLLKQIIVTPVAPNLQQIDWSGFESKVFLSFFCAKDPAQYGRFITFALEDGMPATRDFGTDCIAIRKYIAHITQGANIDALWQKLIGSHLKNPASMSLLEIENEMLIQAHVKLKAVIFEDEGITEILDQQEYAHYDHREIQDRLQSRAIAHPIAAFAPDDGSALAQAMQVYLRSHVSESHISYNDLKKKYGKGSNGYERAVFKSPKETKFIDYLHAAGGPVTTGIKEGGLFVTHKDGWHCALEGKYFIGRGEGIKAIQTHGAPIRRLVSHGVSIEPEAFFHLFDNDFVRLKETSVLPLPFALIRMKQSMLGWQKKRVLSLQNEIVKGTKA